MAATLVGGAFLSASVQTMIDKLTSTEFRDFINNKKLNVSLLKQLQTTLLILQAVLDDAEEKQINNPAVKQWLDDLKDAIFDAEDLLNEISYDSLRCKVENTDVGNKTNQVWNFLSSPFNTFYREINSQMKIMCENLQLFAQHKDILGLQTRSGRVSRRTPSSSILNESIVVGREDDRERLMSMLLSSGGTSNNYIGVVAVLGMGGVGKTTLAQLVYNDKEVQEHFDLKVWACISDDFDILRVTKTLLESVTSRVWESDNLDFLRVELKKNLRDKRFLLVLDDLWNDNYNDWDELVTPLVNGKTGSRVIVTTRQQKVAEIVRTYAIHKLEPISDDDCWYLLSRHAFGGEEFCGIKYPNIEAIGRKIVRKCGGLPIAAKSLGGILRSNADANEWAAILNSDIWNLPNDNILPALLLSYQYLPSYLKRCFSYCSIFPKDYPFEKKNLILLWMAEGFLEHSQGKKEPEEVGNEYFVELLSRSLIQPLNGSFGKQLFVMHDLVNDLAVVSGKSCGRIDCGGNISKNVRHLSFIQDEYDIFQKFETFYDLKCLRSFLPVGPSWRPCYISYKVVDDLLPTLKRLRVLSLSNYINIDMLLDSIGSLVMLRYLDLSNTGLKSLSDTICNLYNLQTLILRNCRNLSALPVHIKNLINLRHLDISDTNIKELPMQIVGLESLRTLTFFAVGKLHTGLSIKELRKLPYIQGKLTILNLHNVTDPVEAYDADLKGKEQIEELVLKWGKQVEDSQIEKDVLDALRPSINLKKLDIDLYGGTSFPSWLGDSYFSNLVSVCIRDCSYCMTLPPLGKLPSLKDLTIYNMKMLEIIGTEFYGITGASSNSSSQPFPSLENLSFSTMPNWKEWSPFEGSTTPFARLKSLQLSHCPELRGDFLSHISSIEVITINGCDRLLETLPTLHCLPSINKKNVDEDSEGKLERTESLLFGIDSLCLLQIVSLGELHTLWSLPPMILRSACLQTLTLYDIPSLIAFPTDGLPTSLQSLHIHRCINLSFLPPETWSNYTSLVELELVSSCDALTFFCLNGFPKLQSLRICGCRTLKSIFICESSSLHPSTLQTLWVHSCKALSSLPQRMDTLNTLEHLTLYNVPELKLSCLPPNLHFMDIFSERVKAPVTEWGLEGLNTLSELKVGGDDHIVNTFLKEKLLPISLVSLTITNLSKLKSFEGNGLRHLSCLKKLTFEGCSGLDTLLKDTLPSALKSLTFWNCARLKSLPKGIIPPSLETLAFGRCVRLESLPEERLPSSLKLLRITECPVLVARYESERGDYWSNIAHIPFIKINGKIIIN